MVRTPQGKIEIDPTGKANGRGAYLCKQTSCWEKGVKKERLAQALKVTLSSEDVDALYASLQAELSKA